jgi:hypothetical protein
MKSLRRACWPPDRSIQELVHADSIVARDWVSADCSAGRITLGEL